MRSPTRARAERIDRTRAIGIAVLAAAAPFVVLAFAVLSGLGLRRELSFLAAAAVGVAVLALCAAGGARLLGGRLPAIGASLAATAAAVLSLFPTYLPGERDVSAASRSRLSRIMNDAR